jgi:prefoldin subunit 5
MYNNLTEEGLRAQAMQLQKEIDELETEYAQIAMQIHNKRAMLNRISELLEIKGTTILQ